MSDRLLVIMGFAWMAFALMFLAYQTVILARMLAEMTALIARTP